jgi:hypothetical protein
LYPYTSQTYVHTYTFDGQCGAIFFIENISYENLRISEEEFNENMGYVDGKTDTDLLLEEGDETEDQERIMILKVHTCASPWQHTCSL